MSDSLLSQSWYRVANLRPRLRPQVQLHRHRIRGERWYVLHDPAGQTAHRLSREAQSIVGLFDGERTLDEIWSHAARELGDDVPTQDETIHLLGTLHAADALATDVSPDLGELFERRRRRARGGWWTGLLQPLSLKVPLADPDEFLGRLEPWTRPLFGPTALVVAGLVVGAAAVLAVLHAPALVDGAADRLLEPQSLLLMAIAYPLLKALHELGHGLAARTYGCEVHEVGLLFIVFLPVPYVDASAAAVLPDKKRRMVVGAAGIAVEAVVASLALFVWLAVDPGWVRSLAYDLLVIGGVSTLLFNGNPLLRFDGYFVLSDALEIPNLATRSQQFLRVWIERHVFRLPHVRDPVTAESERPWLAAYGLGAGVYRVGVVLGIALFVAEKLPVIGALLAASSVFSQLVMPAATAVAGLFRDPRFTQRQSRSLAIAGSVVAGAALLLGAAPFPSFTTAQGVVWPPESTHVRAGIDGFVVALLAAPHSLVAPGDPLLEIRDPLLEARVATHEAQVRELRAQRHAERGADRVRTQILDDQLATARAELARVRRDRAHAVVRSPGAGLFVLVEDRNPVGRFLAKGALAGYVVGPHAATVRVVVPENEIAAVRGRTRGVELRLASRGGQSLAAQVERSHPAAADRLPSPALGVPAGGSWPVDPSDPDGVASPKPVFQLDVALVGGAGPLRIGERAWVRFDHGYEALAPRVARAVRRLFLGRFRV